MLNCGLPSAVTDLFVYLSGQERAEGRQGKILPSQGGLPTLTSAGGVAELFEEHWRLYVWEGSIMKQYVCGSQDLLKKIDDSHSDLCTISS